MPVHKLAAQGSLTTNKIDYPSMLAGYGDFGALTRIGYWAGDGNFNAPIFSNIPQTFQDLLFVVYGRGTNAATTSQGILRLNDDAGSNYSWTTLRGDGASASSSRDVNAGSGWTINDFPSASAVSSLFAVTTLHILNYRSSGFKTGIWRNANDMNGSGTTRLAVGLWRSTAAVNDLRIIHSAANWAAGSTFALYGVRASAA